MLYKAKGQGEMTTRRLKGFTESDLAAFIDNKVRESLTDAYESEATKRFRAFRADRTAALSDNKTPVPMFQSSQDPN